MKILALFLFAVMNAGVQPIVDKTVSVTKEGIVSTVVDLSADKRPEVLTFWVRTTGQMGCVYQVEGSDDGQSWEANVLNAQRCPSGLTMAESTHLLLPNIRHRYVRVNVLQWFTPATRSEGAVPNAQFIFEHGAHP